MQLRTDPNNTYSDFDKSPMYRYSFQGQEKDDEVVGASNSIGYEARMYDTRIGRWLSIDPIIKDFESPYVGFSNNPIWFNDPHGTDTADATKESYFTKTEGNKGLLVYIAKDSYGNEEYTDKADFIQQNEGWDIVVASSWEEAAQILDENFADRKGTYDNLLIRSHGYTAGRLMGSSTEENPENPLVKIRDMSSNTGMIVTTGCNVCWNAGGEGATLAKFFIAGTNRIYLGNAGSSISHNAYDYFDEDDNKDDEGNVVLGFTETTSFRFGGWLGKGKWGGFVGYAEINGVVKHVYIYFNVRTQADGTFQIKKDYQLYVEDRNTTR
ncbi:MAG: hypothetical protein JNJ99_04360 [Crocinitomicaceae bacterium]|nr:hypothetical protein [Crocinitomicaceae bacterium]